jgi:hypothetical protein
MATIRKVLGQSSPLATTNTTLYTVPSATDTVVSSIVVCNRGASETYFRIAVRPAGEEIADKHYLYYDVIVASGDTFAATLGLTLATTDVVTVYATAATISFNLFGQENS